MAASLTIVMLTDLAGVETWTEEARVEGGGV